MYKLRVISGPNRGTSYNVQDGEISIGRQPGNTIILQSAKISKKHCVLVVNNEDIILKDQNSSNGTFINGTLAKSRFVRPGDRIGVGEYVLELVQSKASESNPIVPAIQGLGKVIQFPLNNQASPLKELQTGQLPIEINTKKDEIPSDIRGKIFWFSEKQIMPFFYHLNFKYDWKYICLGVFAAICLGNIAISIYPLIDLNSKSIVKEMGIRARFIAKQLIEKNIQNLNNKTEASTDIGAIDREEGVRLAVLLDMDSRIIAPSYKANQYLTSGEEARFAVEARSKYQLGRETGMVSSGDSNVVIAIEPIKLFNPQVGKNRVTGMAIVSLDTRLAVLHAGEVGLIYSETFILNSILLLIACIILYQLTLKPYQILNDDIDKVLKGEMNEVTHEFMISELNPLWDVINSALQRIPKSFGVQEKTSTSGFSSGPTTEECALPFRMLGDISKQGIVIFDAERRIIYINPIFEELSGIRSDSSLGQTIQNVARDQAFGVFCSDLFDKSSPGNIGSSDEFEFSGTVYKIYISTLGITGGEIKCFILAAEKKGD